MTNAIRDNNHVTVALGVSSTDATITVPFKVDPVTGRLLTDASGSGYTNLTQFVDQTAWRVFYSNGSGDVTELAFGASGTVLQSNGAAAAPTWETAGAGDVVKVGTPVNNQVGVWTGDGTIEGDAALTFDTATDTLTTGIVNSTSLTASEIVITDASKNLVSAAVATYPSLTELTYVKGVTSAIQTQLNAKQGTITFGTGVETALGVNVCSAGAFVTFNGALGTPSSGTVTNLTGTASININGTVGATTPAAGSFTTIGATGIVTTISASNTSRYDASNASAAAYLLRGAVNVGSGGSLGTSDFYVYSDGTVTQIGTERAKNLSIRVNSAEVGAFSSTGLAVTGAIYATSIQNSPIGSVTPAAGAFTALDISGLNAICNATGTTGWSGYNTVNTGGGVVIAVDDSVGGTFGTEAYGSVIRSTAKPLYINIGASSIAKVISTGLAVTGAISASTTLKVGTTLGVGNATPAASGAGITFPATQSASTDPNTLDDYEEGTWTPDVNGTTAGTTTYTTNVGKYTKIGRMVTVNAMSIWTSATGSGDFRINSLPFSAASDSIRTPVTLYFDSVAATAGATVVGRINEGLSNIVPQLIPSGGGAEGAFTFDTAGSMFLSATYMI